MFNIQCSRMIQTALTIFLQQGYLTEWRKTLIYCLKCIVYIIYYNWTHLLNLSTWEMYIKFKMGNASIMNQ